MIAKGTSFVRVQNSLPANRQLVHAKILLPLILFFAFAIRLWGIDYGLPYRYHVDEQAYIPHAARLCGGELDLPAYSFGPNLYLITLCAVDAVTYATGLVMGVWYTPLQFRSAYEADPTVLYVANRAVSAFTGTATVWLIYLLGRRLAGRQVGLTAAAFLAVAFLHVRDSHYAVPDVYATFWIVLTAYAADHVYQKNTLKGWIFAGMAAGIAAGVKFTALTAITMPITAFILHISDDRRAQHNIRIIHVVSRLALICVSFGAGFIIGYPNVLEFTVNSEKLLADLTYQLNFMQEVLYKIEAHALPAPLFYFWSLSWALGLPLAIIGLIGVGYTIYKCGYRSMIFLVFVASYYLLISTATWYTAHYALPLIPFLCLFAAVFVVDRIRQVNLSRYRLWVSWLLPLLILLPSLMSVVKSNHLLTTTDTRTLAKGWIESNIPEGAQIGRSVYASWVPSLSTREELAPQSTQTYEVAISGYDLSEYTLDHYRQAGVEYLVTSSFVTELAWRDQNREVQKQQWYESLAARAILLQEFRPTTRTQDVPFIHDEVYGAAISLWQRDRPGPTIKIYRISP